MMFGPLARISPSDAIFTWTPGIGLRSEEHTSELQSRSDLVCRLLLEKKKSYFRDNRRSPCPDNITDHANLCWRLISKPCPTTIQSHSFHLLSDSLSKILSLSVDRTAP